MSTDWKTAHSNLLTDYLKLRDWLSGTLRGRGLSVDEVNNMDVAAMQSAVSRMLTSARSRPTKTVERLDFPLRVYFRDGECYHDSAVIVFTHGAPAYVRASSPFAIYPWESIKHIIRVADEDQAPGRIAALEAEVVRLTTSHREKRLALRAALGLRDDEATDNLTGELCDRVAYLKRTHDAACRDLASVTEQRDLLKRQLDELRAEVQEGDSVKRVLQRQVDRLRHEPVPSQPPAEPNADNRDSYRSTALRAGAKDCALYIGPKPADLTFVVEMREGASVFDVVAALEQEHGLQPDAYRIREVRSPMP